MLSRRDIKILRKHLLAEKKTAHKELAKVERRKKELDVQIADAKFTLSKLSAIDGEATLSNLKRL